jgi:GNAT superfamily N-acetyltransferase
MVREIKNKDEKRTVSRSILESLKDWFEVDESREKYISESADQLFVAAEEDGKYVGFLTLKQTGNATVELAVMGVLKEYHRKGIGRQMFELARDTARSQGYSFMQVKTVAMGKYPDYDKTNLFYISCGFREFEVFPELWDEDNPCQIYVMAL